MYRARNILVPIDFSEVSRAAISAAIQVADRHGATLRPLVIMERLDKDLQRRIETHPDESVIEDTIAAQVAAVEEALELEYARAVEGGQNLRRVPVVTRVSGGHWVDVALKAIDEEEIDLVVVGTHGGRGSVTALIRGSGAEQLVRKAPCSVFVVKPEGFPYLTD